jgi:hypothetical protein
MLQYSYLSFCRVSAAAKRAAEQEAKKQAAAEGEFVGSLCFVLLNHEC